MEWSSVGVGVVVILGFLGERCSPLKVDVKK